MNARNHPLVWILALGCALRLVLAFGVSEHEFLAIDGYEYREISQQLADGHGFQIGSYRWFEPTPPNAPDTHPEIYRPPLLPVLGAALEFLPGPWLFPARCCSALIGALSILLVFGIAARLFDERAGLIAAAAWACYPPACYYAAHWSTEGIGMLALATAIYAVLTGEKRAILFGVAGALAALARANLLAPVCLMLLFCARRWPMRSSLVAACSLVLALMPWMARNVQVTGWPNVGTSFSAYNAWLGMNDATYVMYFAPDNASAREAMDYLYAVESEAHVRTLEALGLFDSATTQRYWWSEAGRYIQEHPRRAAEIFMRRALHYFQPQPMLAMASAWQVVLALCTTGFAMLLAGFALLRDPRARHPLFAVIVFGGWLAALPFVFHLRLRFPVLDPLLIVLAARGLSLLVAPRPLGSAAPISPA